MSVRSEKLIWDELKKIYLELGEDIVRNGINISKELKGMGFIPYEVNKSFTSIIRKWDGYEIYEVEDYKRIKTIRCITTIYIIETFYNKKIPKEVKSLLITLESIISTIDDFVDTQNLDITNKVDSAIIVLFGNTFIQKICENKFGNSFLTPKENMISEIIFNYLLTISQIPYVEHQTYEIINNPSISDDDIINISVKNYLWRSKDIDAYWDIPSMFIEVKEKNKIKQLLRAYRALELFKKDQNDLKYDLYHKTKTPVTALIKKYESSSNKINNLLEKVFQKILLIYKETTKQIKNEVLINYLNDKINNNSERTKG